jgi:NADH dehydrogenase (ubiquinone) Fe-S protein 6
MLSRTLRARTALRLATPSFRATYSSQKKAEVPANDPVARKEVQTISETNATATSSEGAFDKVLQESFEQGEKLRKQQAPNRQGIWSRSQQPREIAMSGPRFEQTIIEDQVRHSCQLDFKKSN